MVRIFKNFIQFFIQFKQKKKKKVHFNKIELKLLFAIKVQNFVDHM
jgi:hypothetical protein